MTDKRVSPESEFNPDSLKKINPVITPGLLAWWASLNQQQKIWYCQLYPNSDLTKGHLGQLIFHGWDAVRIRRYHQEQANDLKICIMGATKLSAVTKFDHLFQLQVVLAAEKYNPD